MGKSIFYIPDFYCDAAKLVVEADGPVHQYKQQYDRNRDVVLNGLGLRILRFTNSEIEQNLNKVLKTTSGHL